MVNLKSFNFVIVGIAMTILASVVTSCGGEDPEDNPVVVQETGVYKIEIAFYGDLDYLKPGTVFLGGSKALNLIDIYDEDGNKHQEGYYASYDDKHYNRLVAYTGPECILFYVSTNFYNLMEKEETLTVHYKGWINNKLIREDKKTIYIPSGILCKSVYFDFEKGIVETDVER